MCIPAMGPGTVSPRIQQTVSSACHPSRQGEPLCALGNVMWKVLL